MAGGGCANRDARLVVMHESPHDLVVWKPAGLATETRPGSALPSVQSLIAARLPNAYPKLPHRLDRVTCGFVLVALTPTAITFHNAEVQAGTWTKYYLARIAAEPGVDPTAQVGEHRAFVAESNGRARLVRAGGKPARLAILGAARVPGRPDRWHLLIKLGTGRFHQIRVMCEALGLPLAGDPLYDPQQRDPAEFYLEHVVFSHPRLGSRTVATYFVPELVQRGPVAPSLVAQLAALGGATP